MYVTLVPNALRTLTYYKSLKQTLVSSSYWWRNFPRFTQQNGLNSCWIQAVWLWILFYFTFSIFQSTTSTSYLTKMIIHSTSFSVTFVTIAKSNCFGIYAFLYRINSYSNILAGTGKVFVFYLLAAICQSFVIEILQFQIFIIWSWLTNILSKLSLPYHFFMSVVLS